MSNGLEQAEAAFEQGDWCLVHQCLQQWLVDRTAAELSNRTSERALELAIAILEAGDFQERWDIAKLLPAFGDQAIDPLIALLRDDETDADACWFAARALGAYPQPNVVTALLALLQTTDQDELRSIAAEALAHIGSPVIAALTEMLAQDDTRLFAVQSLAIIRRTETIDPLLSVVGDPNPTIRAIALGALGSFHDPRTPPVLIQGLQDQNAMVKQVAVEELGFCNDSALQSDLVSLLSGCLQDQDAAVRQAATIALGRLGSDAAADALFGVLKAPQTSVLLQTEIIWAFHRIGTTIALNYLRQTLHQFNQPASLPLYQTVLTAIGRWETDDAKPQAAQMLAEALAIPFVVEQPMLKQAIANGLGALSQLETLETLIQLLASEEMSVRLHAIAALKALDATTAHQRLKSLVNRSDVPEALKQGAAIALQEW
ncbi:MAG: HEAT repeat domain-containing protein [Stenomitos rutilans HA7619-LM2]|jgi:HEAT repeat protein|nr:HEAT repeat domain-containing protein [Stenomitos rutilans HA7619-LM2]